MQQEHAKANDADAAFTRAALALGHSFEGEIRIGGNYTSLVKHGDTAHISGQVPRVGDVIVVTGRVGMPGAEVPLSQAQHAAKICVMRALAILRQTFGSLASVKQILRVTVYTQCTADFTQQSEVADAASDLLHEILGERGTHSRTSIGVYQLPKNASVELDMIAAIEETSQRSLQA
jgi:enamine deaminase RidA (YjgF/YER057c/UK114 family)